MKLILFFLLLAACTSQGVQIADDFIQGEINVAEKILQDINGIKQKP